MLIAAEATDAAVKGITGLTSGEFGIVGILLGLAVLGLASFMIFYVRTTSKALSSRAQLEKLVDLVGEMQEDKAKLEKVIESKDTIIQSKDVEIARLNEDRVTAAKTATEAVVKSTESMTGIVPLFQNIGVQLQQLLAKG